MTSGEVEHPAPVPVPDVRRPSLEEQAQERGTQPIGDGEFYARDELFDEPGELKDFLNFLYESRRAGIA
ncbi:MAG: hypothetical protein ACRDTG_03125 [Pseudonocardiaceae bacterium]